MKVAMTVVGISCILASVILFIVYAILLQQSYLEATLHCFPSMVLGLMCIILRNL